MSAVPDPAASSIAWAHRAERWTAEHHATLIELRRDLHRQPEIGFGETHTTALIVAALRGLGLEPQVLPGGTGAICDIGTGDTAVALRADIDALPLAETTGAPYASTVPGMAHACGHDAHTAILLGAASVLAGGGPLPGRVRLIFQPAEEQSPGGALAVIEAGGLAGVQRIFAMHCDPRLDAGQVGLRTGPITAASDHVSVTLNGPGGHTSRPQLTADVVYALGLVITELPGLLSRRIDPRSGLSLVWGTVTAGQAPNAIPRSGTVAGTMRVLDRGVWDSAGELIRALVEQVVAPTGVTAEVDYRRGVPPVVNEPGCVGVQRGAVLAGLGEAALAETDQSLGGEDFGWYLDHVPGALARLGVRSPGQLVAADLHTPSFDIDEAALAIGVRLQVMTAIEALLS